MKGPVSRRSFLQRGAAGALAAAALTQLPQSDGAAPRRPLRYAICNETFGDWPFERVCAVAAECGYTGLEIAPFTLAKYVTDIPAQRRRELRRQVEAAHLEVVGLHWLLSKTEGLYVTTPDSAVRRRTAEYLVALAEFCSDLGGKILVFGSPKQRDLLPGVDRGQAMSYTADVLTRVLPALERTGVTMALEPLAPKTSTFLTTAADALELIRRVPSPYCALHLDCLAMATESTPIPDLVRRHRQELAHFHVNDPNGQGPGFGQLDFVPILAALREIDYRGWVSLEVFNTKPGGERLARESIAYLRKCDAR